MFPLGFNFFIFIYNSEKIVAEMFHHLKEYSLQCSLKLIYSTIFQNIFRNIWKMMEYSWNILSNQNIMFLPPVIPNEILLSRLFQHGWTIWNDGTFISKCFHIPKNMCTNRREHCNIYQKVQPKVTKLNYLKKYSLANTSAIFF